MKNERETSLSPGGSVRRLRTLLVDDSPMLLASLRRFLDAEASIQVVGTAANGGEALHKADALDPDLVLMDLNMPGMNGLQTTALLRLRLPKTRIIILTMDATASTHAAAREHGAHGFVGKVTMMATLLAEIRRVCLSNGAADEGGAT
jgi:DNA-binding NarL/FixJ family response regulator